MDAGWRLLKGQLREEASDPSTGSKNRTVIILTLLRPSLREGGVRW